MEHVLYWCINPTSFQGAGKGKSLETRLALTLKSHSEQAHTDLSVGKEKWKILRPPSFHFGLALKDCLERKLELTHTEQQGGLTNRQKLTLQCERHEQGNFNWQLSNTNAVANSNVWSLKCCGLRTKDETEHANGFHSRETFYLSAFMSPLLSFFLTS